MGRMHGHIWQGVLEDDTKLSENQDANSNAAHSPAPTVPPNLSGPNESGDVEGDRPDPNTEKYAAMKDEASAHIEFRSEAWDELPFGGWWGWGYGDHVPNVQPTQSGTSAATAHTCGVSLDDLASPQGLLGARPQGTDPLRTREGWKMEAQLEDLANRNP